MKYFALIFWFFIACNSQNKINEKSLSVPSAPVFIYKTSNDYFNNVPVTLSPDKSKIISYPHPTDLKKGNEYSTPTKLENDYLLDNRGINLNTAFLKLTYYEYAKLKTAPSLTELKSLIVDDNPITELYNCGLKSNFDDIEKQLNEIIKEEKFHKYKKLK